MKNILVPIDGSVYSDKALQMAKEIAGIFDGRVILLNTLQITVPIISMGHEAAAVDNAYDTALREKARGISKEMLQRARNTFGDMAGKVEMISIEGDPAKSIIHFAEENDIDLIIMGSYGLGAIVNRLLMGSVTTKVLHHTTIPVLVVK